MIGAAQNLRVEQSGFDVERVRADFPALHQMVHGKPLVYLDSAATSQKPRAVIEAAVKFYSSDNANVHRGVHALSERATEAYEAARVKIQRFIRALKSREIVFVKGTTEAINLVAHSFVRPRLQAGDEILISAMEHHSNIVPWQLLCEEKGAKLRVAPINEQGELLLPELEALLGPRTRLLALAHVSNALGTINPVRRIVEMAHRHSVPVLLDGAQAVPHLPVDVQALDCDFYAFSGHKAFGPTGIGVLYAKEKWLEEMPPYQGGGDMILSVTNSERRGRDWPGSGDRLSQWARSGGAARIRARVARAWNSSAQPDSRIAADRNGSGQGRGVVVCPRGHPST